METFSDFESSNVSGLKYNQPHGELIVEFKSGDRYSYIGITPQKWDNLKSAKSVGGFVASKITGKHESKKLDS